MVTQVCQVIRTYSPLTAAQAAQVVGLENVLFLSHAHIGTGSIDFVLTRIK